MVKEYNSKLIPLAVFVIFLTTSCVNTKKATYLNKVTDRTIPLSAALPESVIQPKDILSISVSSLNPDENQLYNTPNFSNVTTSSASGNLIQPSGYLVGADGNIQFPLLGNLKAEGLTNAQLKELIRKTLITKKLLVDPVVSVRFLNFRVTVLGEVARSSVLTVPSEKISILEAIGLAGDLTIYAKRDNILLIREENNERIIKRLDLNSDALLTSPYYYLKSGDIIYAEPNKARVANASRLQQVLPLVVSGLSVAAIVIDRLVR